MTVVPELGPALGRLTARAGPASEGRVPLHDLRLQLVTSVFEHAGAARGFGDDPAAATSALNRSAWLGAWEDTIAAVAQRLADHVERQLESAAAESRLPRKQRARLSLGESDRRGIAGRLGAGSLPFLRSLDALERAIPAACATGARGEAGLQEWREALLAVARRLESAWIAVEDAAAREPAVWAPAIERVRAWRRPTWPVWAATALVLLAAAYVGLVLGGYLPATGPVGELARVWWYRS
ncbi:MAG: hypothetical protein ACREOC_07950 [Gemmatimonadales bacterium]